MRMTKQSSCPAPSVDTGGGSGTRIWSQYLTSREGFVPAPPTYTACIYGASNFAQGARNTCMNYTGGSNADAMWWVRLPHDCPAAPTYLTWYADMYTNTGGAGFVWHKMGAYILDSGVTNLGTFVVPASVLHTLNNPVGWVHYSLSFNMTGNLSGGTPGPDKLMCIRLNRPVGDTAFQTYINGIQINIGIS